MYESHFGLDEKPFSLLPDAGFLYLTKKHSLALTMLQYGLESQAPISVVTGNIGCGKTTLLRKLMDEVADDVTIGLITNTHSSFGELLQWVLLAFGLDYRDKSKVERYEILVDFIIEEYAKGKHTVLIVDEAQNMDMSTLEELRMLSNINVDKHQVLQLVLVGQPELRSMLRQPELRQFAQRISADYHIRPLDQSETVEYVKHRLTVAGGNEDIFHPDTFPLIQEHTSGVPRLINILCDTALVYAFGAQQDNVDAKIIREVVKDRGSAVYFDDADTYGYLQGKHDKPALRVVHQSKQQSAENPDATQIKQALNEIETLLKTHLDQQPDRGAETKK